MTILFDKRQMKSIENINILIELKLLLKKTHFGKKLLFEKKKVLKKKSKKNCNLKQQHFYLEKNTFFSD